MLFSILNQWVATTDNHAIGYKRITYMDNLEFLTKGNKNLLFEKVLSILFKNEKLSKTFQKEKRMLLTKQSSLFKHRHLIHAATGLKKHQNFSCVSSFYGFFFCPQIIKGRGETV
jgi:hypothetical protein